MAGRHDFTIEAGATFSRTMKWKDAAGALIDTSGYTARMHIRRTVSESTTIAELTDGDGITLGIVGTGDDAYNIKIALTSVETSALDTTNKGIKGVYDLELSGGGVVTRLLEGEVRISPEVTR